MTSNGLVLPELLQDLIAAGRWKVPGATRLVEVFGESSTHPAFYAPDDIRLENRDWPNETLPQYLGRPSARTPPGDIDPKRSVLIGDLGHDLPFALDYRTSETDPRVAFLGTRVEGVWITVAQTFTAFVDALSL